MGNKIKNLETNTIIMLENIDSARCSKNNITKCIKNYGNKECVKKYGLDCKSSNFDKLYLDFNKNDNSCTVGYNSEDMNGGFIFLKYLKDSLGASEGWLKHIIE